MSRNTLHSQHHLDQFTKTCDEMVSDIININKYHSNQIIWEKFMDGRCLLHYIDFKSTDSDNSGHSNLIFG
jgi:hypothetical protein